MHRSIFTAAVVLCLLAANHALANPDHVLVATNLSDLPDRELVLDGSLEPLWKTGDVGGGFTQMKPDEGKPSTQQTNVYVLYDEEALYVAFENMDSAPDSVWGQVQRRDRGGASDIIFLCLDPFHDRRTGYFFGVTAAGVQIDGTVANEDNYDDTWDGIWQSAVSRTDEGWVVEMRIPFSSFRHSGSRPDGWGVNFERDIYRRYEEAYWAPQLRNQGNRVSKWGVLQGLVGIESDSHMELLPHAVSRWDAPEGGEWSGIDSFQGVRENIGLDLKLVPGSSWTMDLTFNPDFAQVDVDDEVINLSDYPVYLSEKRPFFLEGLDLFQNTPYELLYTRKITDPEFGARVTGKWGEVRGSALAAQNVTESGRRQAVSALRSTINLGEVSTAGVTMTSLYDADTTFHANALGFDGRIRWGESNSLYGMIAGVDRMGSRQQPLGMEGGIFIDGNEGWRGETELEYKGRDYNINDLGFNGYSNLISNYMWLQRYHFPKEGAFQSLYLNLNFYQESMPDGSLYEKSGNWNGNMEFRSTVQIGGGMSWGAGNFREREAIHDQPHDPNNVDNFGEFYPEFHPWTNQWIWFDSDERKSYGYYFEINNGSHREGHRVSTYGSFTWRALSNLELSAESNWVQVRDADRENDGQLTNHLVNRFKVQYSPTLNLSIRATFQHLGENYSTVNDNDLISNLLLAWNYSPGSWLYLVYDDSRSANRTFAYTRSDRTLRLKWTWFTTI